VRRELRDPPAADRRREPVEHVGVGYRDRLRVEFDGGRVLARERLAEERSRRRRLGTTLPVRAAVREFAHCRSLGAVREIGYVGFDARRRSAFARMGQFA